MEPRAGSLDTSTTSDGISGLPAPPSRIRVRTPPTGQFQAGTRAADNPFSSIRSSAKSVMGSSYSGHNSPEEPLLACPSSGGSSGRSESSTDCWVSAIIPGLDDCGSPDDSSSSSWGMCQQAEPVGRQALCPEARNHTDTAAGTPDPAGHEQAGSPRVVQLVATPMQDLTTLLSGCPPQLHVAFMQTAAALAEQHQQQQKLDHLQQTLLLAEQGYEELDAAQAELLLRQQQAQRYSCVPIAALPSLLAAALPHWSSADVGYAALQIRCHLNIIANFSVDTPLATAHPGSPPRGSAAATPQQPDRPQQQRQQQQQQQVGECLVAVDPPCDLMYSELASTILAAAATEAAVASQHVPEAAQSLLVDITAELSSRPELQDRLHQAFVEAAAAGAVVATCDSSLRNSYGSQPISAQGAGAGVQAAAVLPVVKAVKLLCRLLVGPTGLSDIRLLAWLTALVRQQHLANQHAESATLAAAEAASRQSVQAPAPAAAAAAAAAASVRAAAAVISSAQLLEVLGQLLENLTCHQGYPPAAAAGDQAGDGLPGLSCGFAHDWHQSQAGSKDGVEAALAGSSFSVWAAGSTRAGGGGYQQPQHSRSSAAGSGSFPHGSSCCVSSSHSSSGSPQAAYEPVADSDTEEQWAAGGGHRCRARQQYRTSSASSSEGGLRPSSNSAWEHIHSSSLGTRSIRTGSSHGSSAEAAADRAAVFAAFGLGDDAPDATGSSSNSSIGRAAHRPLSSHSSFGEDVWSIVAAAAAATDGAKPQDVADEQLALAEQLSIGQYRQLLHQSTWPVRAGSRSSGGHRSGSSSSSSSSGSSTSSSGGDTRPELKPSRSRLSRFSLQGASVVGGTDTAAPAAAVTSSTSTLGPLGDADAARHNSSSVIHHCSALLLGPSACAGRPCTAGQATLPAWRPAGEEEVCLAQRQAWQAEMLLEQQPWEGAFSPVALCANLAFCRSEGWLGGLVEGSTGSGSLDGQPQKLVNILRISNSSRASSFGCGEGGGEDKRGAGALGCA